MGDPAMEWADLHTHSNCSDGADAPAEVAGRAAGLGMSLLALTDHDTLAGLAEARSAAAGAGVGFVNGVEISASFENREVHVTGLGISEDHPDLNACLGRLQSARVGRLAAMRGRLSRAGIPVEETPADSPMTGRMHLAVRLHAMGVTRTVQEGFDRFLKPGRPGWVPKTLCPADEAVALIQAAGGLAFVAHPGLGKGLFNMLPRLLELPFDGVEAWHVSHTPGMVGDLLALARERGLLVSGGSDCHGGVKGKRPEMGKVRVPLGEIAPLLARLGR